MKKKIVEDKVAASPDLYGILDGSTVDDVIRAMQQFKAEFKDRDIFFKVRHYAYEEGLELQLWERREETDKEFKKRLDAEKKVKDQRKKSKVDRDQRERAQYLKLKQKFEGK